MTILKKEMGSCTENNDEEPLLFSPAPRSKSRSVLSTKSPPVARTRTVVLDESTVGNRLSRNSVVVEDDHDETETVLEGRQETVLAAPLSTLSAPKPILRPPNLSDSASSARLPPLRPTSGSENSVVLPNTNRTSSQKPAGNAKTASRPQRLEDSTSNILNSASQWSNTKASLAVIHPAQGTDDTPFSQRSKTAVCMDLSEIFYDAANKPTNSAKPPLPSTAKRRSTPAAAKNKATATLSNDVANCQIQTFTIWLNFLFSDGTDESDEDAALRGLILQQRLAQERLAATQLFESEAMTRVCGILWTQISKQRIELRTERDLSANLHHRREMVTLLLSYQLPWLRLALETVFRVTIQPKQSLEKTLKQFIVENVLKDDKILAKYTGGRCKVPSGPFEEKYRAELRQVVLNRVLTIIFFLDRAKRANLLEHTPMLFSRSSTAKSTKEVLLTFCREFLRAEGNFVKHLSRVGLKVFAEQGAMDELDFTVTNLRVDLNDGVRLTKMAEIITGDTSLLTQLRVPAVSRLQKFHNVGVALDALVGIPLEGLRAHHIVDGHRDKVLQLLWSVLAQCCLPELLPIEDIVAEMSRIRTLHHVKNSDKIPTTLSETLLDWSRLVCGLFQHPIDDLASSFADGKAACYLIHYYHPTLLRLPELSQTKNAWKLALDRMIVLGGIPEMIPVPEEKSTILCLSFLCARLMETSVVIRAALLIQEAYRRLQARRLRTRQLAAAGILWQAWQRHKDSYYIAQRSRYGAAVKVIEIFALTHWPSLERLRQRRIRQQQFVSATVTIQSNLRRWSAAKELRRLYHEKLTSTRIQSWWRAKVLQRQYLSYQQKVLSVRLVQRAWRQHSQFIEKRNAAATVIQAVVRMRGYRLDYLVDLLDVIAVQSCVRRWLGVRQYRQTVAHCLVIQCSWRQSLARIRLSALQLGRKQEHAATLIQCVIRQRRARCLLWGLQGKSQAAVKIQWMVRKRLVRVIGASLVVQCLWRCNRAAKSLRALRCFARRTKAACSLQAFFRMVEAQFLLVKMKEHAKRTHAATTVQSQWRTYKQATWFEETMHLIVVSQACARRNLMQRHYCSTRDSISSIQAWWRAETMRIKYEMFQRQVICCQSAMRRYLSFRLVAKRRAAVCTLQRFARCELASRVLIELQNERALWEYAATVVQRYFRGFCASRNFELARFDVILLQSYFRKWIGKRRCREIKRAAVILQSSVRCSNARKELCRRKVEKRALEVAQQTSCTQIQALVRGAILRNHLQKQRVAAILIQSTARGYAQWREYYWDIHDIIMVQSVARTWLAQNIADRRFDSAIQLQCMVRCALARREYQARLVAHWQAVAEQQASIVIQRIARGLLARQRALEERCAIKIQKTWRCYDVHVEYMWTILGVISLQSAFRRFLASFEADGRRNAVVIIQSCGRLAIQKTRMVRYRKAATTIQSAVRMTICRRAYLSCLSREHSARSVQAVYRMFSFRLKFRQQRSAVISIQRVFRGYFGRLNVMTMHFSACMMQCIWRGVAERQKHVRRLLRHRAAKVLQIFSQQLKARHSFLRARRTVVSIQALYRGSRARRNCPKKIKETARRISKANRRALRHPELQIGFRTTTALSSLLKNRNLTDVMAAIWHLEVVTRLSKQSCCNVCDAGAFEILFLLIQTCNRSLPHVKLVSGALLVMRNVVQHKELVQYMLSATGTRVLLHLLQMFRDKEFVFCLVVPLLDLSVRLDPNLRVRNSRMKDFANQAILTIGSLFRNSVAAEKTSNVSMVSASYVTEKHQYRPLPRSKHSASPWDCQTVCCAATTSPTSHGLFGS